MLTKDVIDGKMLLIDNLHIMTVNEQLMLSLDAYIDEKLFHIIFQNISSLRVENCSYPIQISGLAVADHSAKGWQSDVRYEVYDYEDGTIRFFCEEIAVSD